MNKEQVMNTPLWHLVIDRSFSTVYHKKSVCIKVGIHDTISHIIYIRI
jgi:hypothetical protein